MVNLILEILLKLVGILPQYIASNPCHLAFILGFVDTKAWQVIGYIEISLCAHTKDRNVMSSEANWLMGDGSRRTNFLSFLPLIMWMQDLDKYLRRVFLRLRSQLIMKLYTSWYYTGIALTNEVLHHKTLDSGSSFKKPRLRQWRARLPLEKR